MESESNNKNFSYLELPCDHLTIQKKISEEPSAQSAQPLSEPHVKNFASFGASRYFANPIFDWFCCPWMLPYRSKYPTDHPYFFVVCELNHSIIFNISLKVFRKDVGSE